MKLPSFLTWPWGRSKPPIPTVHQHGIQADVIRRLMRVGCIDSRTVLNMGTNDATKLFTRLRRLGLLFEAEDPNGHDWIPNFSGHGSYKRHKWTGKVPAGWSVPEERRNRKRGCR